MSRKLVNIAVYLVLGICILIFVYNLCNYKSLKIEEEDVKQIQLVDFDTIFHKPITDKKDISNIIHYLNSLKLYRENVEGIQYDGPWYTVKIKLKNNAEKLVCIDGSICGVGKSSYKINYYEGVNKAEAVFGDVMQKEEMRNREHSIEGNVISVKREESGVCDFCVIKAKNNVKFNVDISKTIIMDVTENANITIHKHDFVRIFYRKKNKEDVKNITAFSAYINKTHKQP